MLIILINNCELLKWNIWKYWTNELNKKLIIIDYFWNDNKKILIIRELSWKEMNEMC